VIPGNKKADTTAYEASSSPTSIQIYTSSLIEIFNIFHQKILEEWQKSWKNIPLSNKLKNVRLYIKKLSYPPDTVER